MAGSKTSGACLCGTIRYAVDGPLDAMLHCHCSMCRKHHGAAFATFVGARLADFSWLEGTHALAVYRSSPQGSRYFCRSCGSVAPRVLEQEGRVVLPAGNLVDEIEQRPGCHVFAGSRAPWYEITDGLPQYPAAAAAGRAGTANTAVTSAPPSALGGSCLCGDVAYRLSGPIVRMVNCHCSRCRRGRSAAHATNVFCKLEDLEFIRGAELITEYRVPQARHFATAFCRRCGAAVPRLSRERGLAVVPAGSLDGDPGLRPLGHIFVGSKASWFEITDGRPQHQALDPS